MREAEKGGWGKRCWFSGSLDLCLFGFMVLCHIIRFLSHSLKSITITEVITEVTNSVAQGIPVTGVSQF